MTDIGLLVRSANPVPDDSQQLTDDELGAVLLLAQQRSGDMDTKERTSTAVTSNSRRHNLAIAIGSFAAALAVVGVLLWTGGSTEDTPPATVPSTTTTVVELTTTTPAAPAVNAADQTVLDGFIGALNSGDMDVVDATLSPSAVTVLPWDEVTYARDAMLKELRFVANRGSTTALSDCRPDGDRVFCRQTRSGDYEQVVYRSDAISNVWFTIDGDHILQIEDKCQICPDQERFEAVVDWVASFDPSGAASMGRLVAPPAIVDGMAEAWATYAPLWLQSSMDGNLGEVAFVEALVAELNAGDWEAYSARVLSAATQGSRLGTSKSGNTFAIEDVARDAQDLADLGTHEEVLVCHVSEDGLTRCDIERFSDYDPWAPLPTTGQYQVQMDGETVVFFNWLPYGSDPWFQISKDWQAWVSENYPDADLTPEFQKVIVERYREQAGLNG